MADRGWHGARGWVSGGLVLLLVGCGGGPTIVEEPAGSVAPSPAPNAIANSSATTPAPSGSLRSTPAPTPRPSEPAEESLPLKASVERDGVRITINLWGDRIRAGRREVLTTTIKNTGRDTLRWMVDGCGVDVGITAALPEARWRPSTRTVEPLQKAYAQWLRDQVRLEQPIHLRFDPGTLLGQVDVGCADLGIPRSLKPGASLSEDLVWDGQAAGLLGPPPSGPVVITATFDYWWRGSTADANVASEKPIVLRLDSRVVGGPAPAFLSPGEAIDAALADPEFGAWAMTQILSGTMGVVRYDPAANVWIVGLVHQQDTEPYQWLHAALVDPLTGEVLAIREHAIN